MVRFNTSEMDVGYMLILDLLVKSISVGVGAALGNGEKTLCFFGDGAAEEDYALTAYGFAATHKLPVLFICTDNNLSVLSPKS